MGGYIKKYWSLGAQPTFMGVLRPRRGAIGQSYVVPFLKGHIINFYYYCKKKKKKKNTKKRKRVR